MAYNPESLGVPRVLVVDDHAAQLETLCDILGQHDFEPVGCSDAASALEALEHEDFAVAILDQRLPDLSGTQLLERIHELSPGIRAIIHTAYAGFESAKQAINAGAFAYVEKVSDPADLVAHVDRAVQDLMSEALLGSAARLRTVIENAPDYIIQTDEEGTISFANRALPGRSLDDVVGASLYEWLSSDAHDRARLELHRVFATGANGRYRVTGNGPTGEEHEFDCRVAPVVVGGMVVGAIHTLRDEAA